jgi:hypothetical protein
MSSVLTFCPGLHQINNPWHMWADNLCYFTDAQSLYCRTRIKVFTCTFGRDRIPRECSIFYWSEFTYTYVGLHSGRRPDNGQVMSTVCCCTIRMDGAPCHLTLTLPEIVFLSCTLIRRLQTFCSDGRTKCMGRVTRQHIKRCRQVSNNK